MSIFDTLSIDMDLKVNVDNFLCYYMFHPLAENLSAVDRLIVTISTAVLGVMTLGLVHLACRLFLYDRHVSDLTRTAPLPLVPYGQESPPPKELVVVVITKELQTAFVEEIQEQPTEDTHKEVLLPVPHPLADNRLVVQIILPPQEQGVVVPESLLQKAQQMFQSYLFEEESGLSMNAYFGLSCTGMALFAPEAFALGALASGGYSFYRNSWPSLKQGEKAVTVIPTTAAIVGAVGAAVQWSSAGKAGGIIGRLIVKMLPVIGGGCAGRTFLKIQAYVKGRFSI